MTLRPVPRWHYRLDVYGRAFARLRQIMEVASERELAEIEKEGAIQRFEYTWELAWKLMKDYLEGSGVVFATITPGSVLKAALKANLIENGEDWMDALDARNKMSHVYDVEAFETVLADISARFLLLLEALYFKLIEQRLGDESE